MENIKHKLIYFYETLCTYIEIHGVAMRRVNLCTIYEEYKIKSNQISPNILKLLFA